MLRQMTQAGLERTRITRTLKHMVCISADIRNLTIKAIRDTIKDLLNWLKTQYGITSISATYSDIITVDKLRILRDYDLTSTLDKLLALFMCLKDNKLIYIEVICTITLLAKLLLQIKKIAQSYNQKSSNTLFIMTLQSLSKPSRIEISFCIFS